MAFYKHVLAWANGLETNDVIADWRHYLLRHSLAVISGSAYTIYSILEITAAVYFPVTSVWTAVLYINGSNWHAKQVESDK